MRTPSFVAAAIGLTTAAAFGSVRTSVSSTTTGFEISPSYAATSSNPLYQQQGNQGENPLFEGSGGSLRIITISGYHAVGMPAMMPGGGVVSAFASGGTQGTTPGTLPGLYTFAPGSSVGERIGGNTASAHTQATLPAASSKGVVFKSLSNNQPILVSAASNGQIIGTLPSQWKLSSVNGVAASTKVDAVCVTGVHEEQGADGSTNQWPMLLVGSSGGLGQRITVQGNNFSSPVASSSLFAAVATNGAGDSSVIMSARDAGSGLATGRRQYQPLLVRKQISLAADENSATLAVCDTGSIVLLGNQSPLWDDLGDDGLSFAPVATPNLAAPALISVGDSLGGSTVAELSLSPQSFVGDELYFHALLADGSSGIFAITVPEPVTLGVGMLGLPMLMRRRR